MSGVSRRPLWTKEIIRALIAALSAAFSLFNTSCFRILRRIERFIEAVSRRRGEFHSSPRHANRHETNLEAALFDWNRDQAKRQRAPSAIAEQSNQFFASRVAATPVSRASERREWLVHGVFNGNEERKTH